MTIFRRPEAEPRASGSPSLTASGLPVGAAAIPAVIVPPSAVPDPPAPAEIVSHGTVLAAGTVLEGTLRAAEPVHVAGVLQGTLEAEGTVVIEAGGRVEARVVAPDLVVAGVLDGRVHCPGRLEVRATGQVKGQLHVGTLRIDEGAQLDGQLQMASAGSPLPELEEPAPPPAPSPSAEAPRTRKERGGGPPVLARLALAAGE